MKQHPQEKKFTTLFVENNRMSMKRSMPVYIREPDPDSKIAEDRLHWAILRGKIVTVNKLLDSGEKLKSFNILRNLIYNP